MFPNKDLIVDVNNNLWDSVKYIWEAIVVLLSGLLSFITYKHKKNKENLENMANTIDDHDSLLKVFEERFKYLMSDMNEIKQDLKKILFKL